MQTLTYGLKLPENGDKGSIWFPALEDDITQLDGHSHNGTDSAKLTTASINNTTQSILAVNWVAVGDGTGRYYQNITLPAALSYDTINISFKTTAATVDPLLLDVEKITASSYKVFINDNSLSLTAIYS